MVLDQPAKVNNPVAAPPRAASGNWAASGVFRYGMTLPTIIALVLVVGFPLAFALFVSTHAYDLTEGGIGDGGRESRSDPVRCSMRSVRRRAGTGTTV